jgi:hypothetical protein
MDAILYGWPYAGLVLLPILLVESVLRARGAPDPRREILLRLLWPMYLLHQFEEHGIDALGRHFAFLADMCRTLGHADVSTCPADAAFVFAVNVVGCTFSFLLPVLFARTRPGFALFGWSIPVVNAFAHVGAALKNGAYNPGLVTSIVLFLPLGFMVIRTCLRDRVLPPFRLPLVFMAGGLVHAVLLGSVLAHGAGLISHAALLVINSVNGLIPGRVGYSSDARTR